MDHVLALLAATPIVFPGTLITLNKQKMTAAIHAVGMRIGRLAALMTPGDNVFRDPLSQPLVEHKILPDELALQTLFLYLSCIVDDSSLEVKHVVEPVVQHV